MSAETDQDRQVSQKPSDSGGAKPSNTDVTVKSPGGGSPPIPDDVLKSVSAFMLSSKSGPMIHPFWDKLQPEHIPDLIRSIDTEFGHEIDFQKRSQWFGLGYTLIGVAVLVFLVVFLKSDPDLFKIALTAIISGGVSFVGGYGLGKKNK